MNRTLIPLLCALAIATVPLAMISPPSASLVSENSPGVDDLSDRFVPRFPGVERAMTFFYGPFTIPPGQDINRVTADVPVHGGFLTSVQANLYDLETGTTPSNQAMHIHHAHWFRTSEDPDDEYYTLNLAWVFGTGEERTKGDINARSAADPNGPSYGIFIAAGQPQALIYMLHNKDPVLRTVYVGLDVSFVYGTAEEIAVATDCGPLPLDATRETCRAGQDFHHVHGTLFGNTYDVPRNLADPLSQHVWGPADAPAMLYTASADGIAIGSAGHLHPNGVEVVVANLGPDKSGCEADLDGDGWPGVTLLRSKKFDMVPEAWPHSEESRLGATKPSWRAPIHEGDRIAQYGVYENGEYASYEAMSYAGMYVDRAQTPPAFDAALCTANPAAAVDGLRARLLDAPGADQAASIETIISYPFGGAHHGHCGVPLAPPCERDVGEIPVGAPADTIHIAGFQYIPGDRAVSGDLGAPPKITRGVPLRVINEDVAALVRHTVTTCAWPCNGPYVANYPHPDGFVDTGKLGNLDYIDGGVTGPDAVPMFDIDTASLEDGLYSYYCRIHPWMRGWFEVVA